MKVWNLIPASKCLSEKKLSLLSWLATALLNSLNSLPFSPFLNWGECWVWISENRCLYDRSHLRYESDLTETEWNEVGRQ